MAMRDNKNLDNACICGSSISCGAVCGISTTTGIASLIGTPILSLTPILGGAIGGILAFVGAYDLLNSGCARKENSEKTTQVISPTASPLLKNNIFSKLENPVDDFPQIIVGSITSKPMI